MSDPVITAVKQWSERDTDFALITVIGVRGSTYRGLGARQAMGADGTSVGTVSGGCLDVALREEVAEVIATGKARTVSFDLSSDDDEIWGWGIGCNGVTEVLVEPGSSALTLADMIESHEHRQGVIVHQIGPEPERVIKLTAEEGPLGEAVGDVLNDRRHKRIEVGNTVYFLEVVGAAPSLVVCGAGHDALPMVEYADLVGFDVTVVDDRSTFLDVERFPRARSLINSRPSELAAAVDLGPGTSVIIMSHNYIRDLEYLGSVVGTSVDYIGTLGPGRRLQRLLDDLVADGFEITPDDLDRLHGPAGLDIGADGPRQIALAVVSEVLAVRNGLQGGFLRNRKGVVSSALASNPQEESRKVP
ncbi:MAG: hypothetical protein GEU79_12090 [Acidimicrobiia bacterium]|nr:hypothetical protein [Acidimicrobiia bacterium]